MNSIDLEYFRAPLEWLDDDIGPMLTKLAVVCLDDQGHRPGVAMPVDDGDSSKQYEVLWKTVLDSSKSGTLPNDQEITQKGAECISLMLASKLTNYHFFETAQKGTGIDFWLKESPNDMKFDAGLEVSGIRMETPKNTVSARIAEKTLQARNSQMSEINVYISVVEFSTPKVFFLKA